MGSQDCVSGKSPSVDLHFEFLDGPFLQDLNSNEFHSSIADKKIDPL
jgi:hypothetical protein